MKSAIFTLLLLSFSLAHAQCDCDIILHDKTTGDGLQSLDFANIPDSTSSTFTHNSASGWVELTVAYSSIVESGMVKPGTSICLTNIIRRLYIQNIAGDSLNPVTIRNYPGTTAEIHSEPSYAGLQIHNSHHFLIDGSCGMTGDASGIFIHGINANGIEISGKSEQFAISYVKIDTAGTGIKVKDNRDGYYAGCTPASGVSAPTDSLWFAENIEIHHCQIQHISNEGIYMNNTSYKFDYSCDTGRLFYGYEMDGVYLHHNLISDTGKDGIQTTGVVRNCIIHHNTILNTGTEESSAQGNGIQFGEGCAGQVYNNWIEKTYANGLLVAGIGEIDIYQNIILQTGADAILAQAGTQRCDGSCKYSQEPAYFGLHNFYDLDRLSIYNNTIAYTEGTGINIDAPASGATLKKVYINNNIITEWTNAPMGFISSETANYDGFTHAGNNFIKASAAQVGFVNGSMNTSAYGPGQTTDLHLTTSSSACDAGISFNWTSLSAEEVISGDFDGNDRELQARIDCGAFESNHTLPAATTYINSSVCDCALPAQIYGFDGTGLGAGYKICLLDTLRTGRIWFQNLEGQPGEPVQISALQPLAIEISQNTNAISFKNTSGIALAGETISVSASNSLYATVDFLSGNTGKISLSNLVINGSDDLIDLGSGSGTNLADTLILDNISLICEDANNNLIRIKGTPALVKLNRVKATSGELNQTLLEVNLKAGGDLEIYNSIFDGFDTDLTLHKWIQLSMQPVGSSYTANSVKIINNTFANLAPTNTSSTSNFRILHKSGTGYIDSLLFINNAIHKSSITTTLTTANYKSTANQISVFTANHEFVHHNYATQILDSLHIDADYLPLSSGPSHLLNAGTNFPEWQLPVDYYGAFRKDTVYAQTDIGATEMQYHESSSARKAYSSTPAATPLPTETVEFNVYPNPTSNQLNISGTQTGDKIILMNQNGVMMDKMVVASQDEPVSMLLSNYPEGIYYLRVVQSHQNLFRQVIVQH